MATPFSILKFRSSDLRFKKFLKIRRANHYVFISSSQQCSERKIIAKTLWEFCNNFEIPVYTIRVEYLPEKSSSKIGYQIFCNILKSKYFIAVLNKSSSKMVKQEIEISLKEFPSKRILVFINNNDKAHYAWQSTIEQLEKIYVKYLPYNTLRDLKPMLAKWILLQLTSRMEH